MNQILFISIILFLLSCTSIAQTDKTSRFHSKFSPSNFGMVKIIVLGTNLSDESGKEVDESLYMQPFRVYLQSKTCFKEMVYKNNGEFELEVHEGIYKIFLRENFEEPLPYQRANFYVAPNKVTTLKISFAERSHACDATYGFVNAPEDSPYNPELHPQNYYKYLINSPYEVVIKHCWKQTRNEVIAFNFALLTYKGVTIYADKMEINKENLMVTAYGNKNRVLIEFGNCRREAKRIKLSLKRGLICRESSKYWKITH